jgi:hypothetical protein
MENIYHRYINLPFEIKRPDMTLEFPEHILHKAINDHVDEQVNKFNESLGLKVTHTELFYTPPNGQKIPIHTDLPALDNRVKINLTWGPEEGVIRWFEHNNPEDMYHNDNTVYKDTGFTEEEHQNLLAEEHECTLVYEANTNRPSIVNVGQLHGTYNPGNEGRWTLCFHIGYLDYEDFLTFDKALEYYKDYLV